MADKPYPEPVGAGSPNSKESPAYGGQTIVHWNCSAGDFTGPTEESVEEHIAALKGEHIEPDRTKPS